MISLLQGATISELAYRHGGGGMGGGMSDVLRTMAHAAIWSTVGRLIWHAPAWLVVAAFAAGALYLIRSRMRRTAGK
jgi:hypothetical protein